MSDHLRIRRRQDACHVRYLAGESCSKQVEIRLIREHGLAQGWRDTEFKEAVGVHSFYPPS